MTNYDSIKNQYRALYRTAGFKQAPHHLYEMEGRFSILPASQNLATPPEVRNVQCMTETRLLSIMQELATNYA